MGSGILRAVGDSRRPFIFLVVSAILNTILDLVFVLGFRMGVEGVAYATIIAQGVSAMLVILTLTTAESCIRITLQKLKIHLEQLKPTEIGSIIASFETEESADGTAVPMDISLYI